MASRPKAVDFRWKKTHRPAGGLFLGLRFVYPITVVHDLPQWKLTGGKFVKQPTTFRTTHLDLGLVFWTLTIYFRRPVKIL
jgi:hypothetical protein